MKIEINDDDAFAIVHQALMQMEEDMPRSKKLTKAIKRINHNIMIPTDWEETVSYTHLTLPTKRIV